MTDERAHGDGGHDHGSHGHGSHGHGSHGHGSHGSATQGADDADATDRLAELLDLDAGLVAPQYEKLLRAIAAPVSHVVDLGAGSGAHTSMLLRSFPDATVTAIDSSAPMLARLRERAAGAGNARRVRVVEADLDEAWPALAPVDLVWAAGAMHHLGDPARAFARVHAALAPGGCFVIAELDAFPRFLAGTPEADLEDELRALTSRHRDDAGMHMHADWRSLGAAAGFDTVVDRAVTVELPAPLPPAALRYAELVLRQLRDGFGDQLPAADLDRLDGVLRSLPDRRDLHLSAERSIWVGRTSTTG